jgi:hypothetical protein
MLQWSPVDVIDSEPCFVIAMEVLDNLPHDKVVWVKVGAGADVGAGAKEAASDSNDRAAESDGASTSTATATATSTPTATIATVEGELWELRQTVVVGSGAPGAHAYVCVCV